MGRVRQEMLAIATDAGFPGDLQPLKWIACIGMPGQALACQLGNLKFRALRVRAEAALDERFRIRDVHDTIMAAGAVTLAVLESPTGRSPPPPDACECAMPHA